MARNSAEDKRPAAGPSDANKKPRGPSRDDDDDEDYLDEMIEEDEDLMDEAQQGPPEEDEPVQLLGLGDMSKFAAKWRRPTT